MFQYIPKFFIILLSKQYDRELSDRFCLYQCKRFKKFIHCSESTRQNHKSIRIFYKQHLSNKKMFKSDRPIHVGIGLLLKWQLYITTYRNTTVFKSATVCSFHYTGTSTSH